MLAKAISLNIVGVAAIMWPTASWADSIDVGLQITAQYTNSTVFLAVRGKKANGKTDAPKSGTGFIISPDGYVITAAHLFEDSNNVPYASTKTIGSLGTNFDILAPTGIIQPLEYVRANTDVDVALIKLPAPLKPTLGYSAVHTCRLANPAAAQGERVYALGFPLGQTISINAGTLSSVIAPKGMWKTDILVYEGSSGSPVFDGTGHVIGVIRGGLPEYPGNNFIVPVNLALDLMMAGQGVIDECGSANTVQEVKLCEPDIVEYDIKLIKDDHPTFTEDSKPYEQVFSAHPGYRFERYEWNEIRREHATEPKLSLVDNGAALQFDTVITSGPFQREQAWVGVISGKIVTTQTPIKCGK